MALTAKVIIETKEAQKALQRLEKIADEAAKEIEQALSKGIKPDTKKMERAYKDAFAEIEKASGKAGKESGKEFSSGFGGALAALGVGAVVVGLGAIANATIKTQSQMSKFTKTTGDELTALTAKTQATADVFEQDFNDTLVATNTLAKAFGISFEESQTIMNDGFLKGANLAGEMGINIKEFAQDFKDADFTAEEMTGFLALSDQAGIFDGKAADAVSEFGVKIVEMTQATRDALQGIGIDDKALQAQLESGAITQKDAIQLIAKEIEKTGLQTQASATVLADVFGSPAEDAQALVGIFADLDNGLKSIVIASDEYTQNQQAQLAASEGINTALGEFSQAILPAMTKGMEILGDLIAFVSANLDTVGVVVAGLGAIMAAYAISAGVAALGTSALGVAIAGASGAMGVLNAIMLLNPAVAITAAIVGLVAVTAILIDVFNETGAEALASNEAQGKLIDTQIKATQVSKIQEQENLKLLKTYKELGEQQSETGVVTQEFRDAQLQLMRTYPGLIDSSKTYEENLVAVSKATSGGVTETDKLSDANQNLVKEYKLLSERTELTEEEQARLQTVIEEINGVYPGAISGVESYHEEIKILETRAGLSSDAIAELDAKATSLSKEKKVNTLKNFGLQIRVAREALVELDGEFERLANAPRGRFQQLISAKTIEGVTQAQIKLNQEVFRKVGAGEIEATQAEKALVLIQDAADARIGALNQYGIFSAEQIEANKQAELDAIEAAKAAAIAAAAKKLGLTKTGTEEKKKEKKVVEEILTFEQEVTAELIKRAGERKEAAEQARIDAAVRKKELEAMGRSDEKPGELKKNVIQGGSGLESLADEELDTVSGLLDDLGILSEESLDIIDNAAARMTEAIGQTFADLLTGEKEFGKSFVLIALDTLNALIPIFIAEIYAKEIASKNFVGIATATILTGVLMGFVSAAKSGIQGMKDGGTQPGRNQLVQINDAPGSDWQEIVMKGSVFAKYKPELLALNEGKSPEQAGFYQSPARIPSAPMMSPYSVDEYGNVGGGGSKKVSMKVELGGEMRIRRGTISRSINEQLEQDVL